MKVNPEQMKKDVANGVMIGRVTWGKLIDYALELEDKAGVQHIKNVGQLKAGFEYWLVDNFTGKPTLAVCKEAGNCLYFKERIWAAPDNNQAMLQWEIFGPLPVRMVPDFAALMRAKGSAAAPAQVAG